MEKNEGESFWNSAYITKVLLEIVLLCNKPCKLWNYYFIYHVALIMYQNMAIKKVCFKTVMKALFEIIFEDNKQILYNLSFLKVLFES